jgi:hypothetical protein
MVGQARCHLAEGSAMSEFFKGWRRKAGCVSLTFALLFMAAWMRSTITWDQIDVTSNESNSNITIGAAGGSMFLFFDCVPPDCSIQFGIPDWRSVKATSSLDQALDEVLVWQYRWCGFVLGCDFESRRPTSVVYLFMIPYWSIILPLTVLCFWLFLQAATESDSQPSQSIHHERDSCAAVIGKAWNRCWRALLL